MCNCDTGSSFHSIVPCVAVRSSAVQKASSRFLAVLQTKCTQIQRFNFNKRETMQVAETEFLLMLTTIRVS